MKHRTPRGIVAERAHSYASLESVALQFREKIGLSEPDAPINGRRLYDLIQDIPIEVQTKRHRIFCRVDRLQDGLEAKACYLADTGDYEVVLTEQTYAWLEEGHPRGKSGLVHECSHIVLHPNLLQKLSTLPFHSKAALYRGDAVPHEFCRDTEWQADALTSAITMPAKGIAMLERSRMSRRNAWPMELLIADHFMVSEETAGYRWQTYQQRKEQLLKA